eukprot:354237-Chlamydomonas_euryale.AAC.3
MSQRCQRPHRHGQVLRLKAAELQARSPKQCICEWCIFVAQRCHCPEHVAQLLRIESVELACASLK